MQKLKKLVKELEGSLEKIKQQKEHLEQELPKVVASAENELSKKQKIIEEINHQKTKAEYEAKEYRLELEATIRKKAAADQDLEHMRQLILQAESKQAAVEEKLRVLKKEIEESTMARRKMEEHLRRKDVDVQDLEQQKRILEKELRTKELAEGDLKLRLMQQEEAKEAEAKMKRSEIMYSVVRESHQQSALPYNVGYLNSEMESKKTEALQLKVDELTLEKKKAENDLKSLKSELNSLEIQKNAVEEKAQLFKDCLEEANNKMKLFQLELQQKNSSQSSHMLNLREMESELANSRQKSEELRQEAAELKKSIFRLQEEVKSLQRDKDSLEQECLFHKTEIDGLTEQLRMKHEDLLKRASTEQESSHKTKFLEDDLSNAKSEIDKLRFKVSELTRVNVKSENDIRSLKINVDTCQQDRVFFEEKLKSQRTELENMREQLSKAKEEIMLKTKAEQETQLKNRSLDMELQKTNRLVQQLKEKVEELKRTNAESGVSLKNVKSELEKLAMEKSSHQQQVDIFKSQAEGFKSQIKIVEDELMKKNKMSQEYQLKLRSYEEDMKRMAELQQKVKELNLINMNNEKDLRALKSELNSTTMEKKSAEMKVQSQKTEIDDVNNKLKKAKEDLQKESREVQKNQTRIRELEAELQKCKLVAEDFRRKSENLRDASVSSEKYAESFKLELQNLKKEKSVAQEKVHLQTTEMNLLKQRLDKVQMELQQRQRDDVMGNQKIKKLEEELGQYKKMVQEHKSKFDLQRKEHEQKLQTIQRETHQKLQQKESSVKLEFDQKARTQSQNIETAERENKFLRQEIEQLKAINQNILKNKQEMQKDMDALLMKFQYAEKERGTANNEIHNAKSYIVELENENVKLKANVTQADNIRKEVSLENTRLKHALAESERKQELTDQESRTLKEQIFNNRKEMSTLKEMVTIFDSTVNTNGIKEKAIDFKLQDQLNHQDSKELFLRPRSETEVNSLRKHTELDKCDLVKRELQITTHVITANEDLKEKLEEELRKMKLTAEITKLEQNKVTDEVMKLMQESENILKDRDIIHNKSRELEADFINHENSYSVQTSRVYQTPNQYVDTANVNVQMDISVMKHDIMSTDLANNVFGKIEMTNHDSQDIFSTHHPELIMTKRVTNSFVSPGNSSLKSEWSHTGTDDKFKFRGLRDYVTASALAEAKILDLNTLKRLELGMTTIEEVQESLEDYISSRTVIAGLYVESGKKKVSFMDAANKGLMAKSYALEFLEAQAATGFIIDTQTGRKYSVEEAVHNAIVSTEFKDKLLDAEKAAIGYVHGGRTLSVFQAMENRLIERLKGKKIIELQISTGGIIDPQRSIRLSPETAIDQGMLNKFTLTHLHDPSSNPRGFHNPNTGQSMYYLELLKLCVLDVSGKDLLLPFGDRSISSPSPTKPQRILVVDSNTGTEMTIYDAYCKQKIDQKMYQKLSEQESEWKETSDLDSNNLTVNVLSDGKSGRGFVLEDALKEGTVGTSEVTKYKVGIITINELADQLIAKHKVLTVSDCPITGFWDTLSNKRLTFLQALQLNLVERLTAIRLLEAQACTGGIYDPSTGKKYSVSDALKRGLIDDSLNRQIQQAELAYSGVISPHTKKPLSVAEAMKNHLFPKDVGQRCLEFQFLTGGLTDPNTGGKICLEEAIRTGLIDANTAMKLKDDKFHAKSLTCPKTKKKMSFKEALDRAVYDCHTGLKILEASKPQVPGGSTSIYYMRTF
ncbi:plectin-like [Polypterus senegalus]|uniref:plectin-like n=1 Tax=Polypterus senegalus TaxID=55291 RepID=UPI001965DABB|nr:plectin-like [Polypterus senegalus]